MGGFRRFGKFATGAGLVALLGAAAWARPAAPGAPAMEIDQLEIDLGVLAKGVLQEARFVLRNKGDGALRIRGVKPG